MTISWRAPGCQVMGVLNVTPDSFSDGQLYLDPAAAVARALKMESEGAGMIDMGAESTRPGSQPVSPDVQLERLRPVMERLQGRLKVPVSIDTTSTRVAREMLSMGAAVINDTSAGDDEGLFELVAEKEAGLVLMHRSATPDVMQQHTQYVSVVEDVLNYLLERARRAIQAGVTPERICLDPGLGFGKTLEQNLKLSRELSRFVASGYAVLYGPSRKSFLGMLTGEQDPARRDAASVAAALAAARQGVQWLRMHNVADCVQALKVDQALLAEKV